jgi:hypothetical protein
VNDDQVTCEALTASGAATLGSASVTGTVKAGVVQQNQAAGTVQTLSTGNTITVAANQSSVRVTAGGAVTGIIIAPGTLGGQLLTVIHEGAAANTLTMAASGTSNVANGVSCVITGPSARLFVWDSITALWYQCT